MRLSLSHDLVYELAGWPELIQNIIVSMFINKKISSSIFILNYIIFLSYFKIHRDNQVVLN
jgi:hypothetical protein